MVRNRLMIPLKDNIPTKTTPIITISLILVNIFVFLWQRFLLEGIPGEAIFRTYGLVPNEFLSAVTSRWDLLPFNTLTVFTSMFLHAGVFHLAGNMLYLWIFGNNVEDAMGRSRFVLFYLLSGIVAAAFQFFYDPTAKIPMIGASGAVSGVLGAYLVLFPYARVSTLIFIVIFIKIVRLPAILLLSIWFFIQVFFSQGEGVAWYAHIGGFIFGVLTIRLFVRKVRRRRAIAAES
jgi:membrane associated rhomboid family serine protease